MKNIMCARDRGAKTLLIELPDFRDAEDSLWAARPSKQTNKQKPKSKSDHSYRDKIELAPALFNAKQWHNPHRICKDLCAIKLFLKHKSYKQTFLDMWEHREYRARGPSWANYLRTNWDHQEVTGEATAKGGAGESTYKNKYYMFKSRMKIKGSLVICLCKCIRAAII